MSVRSNISKGLSALLVMAGLQAAPAAHAGDYVDTTPFTYTTACRNNGTRFATRTVNVTETTPIIDLDVGLISEIAYRLDTDMWIQSPAGTRVKLLNGSGVDTARANYNVLFDDDATVDVDVAPHNTPDSLTAAPYENTVEGLGTDPLSAFIGQNPQGDWQFQFCDETTSDGGATVQRMELRFAADTDIDLELAISTSSVLNVGNTATFSISVFNNSSNDATGVAGDLVLGSGLTLQSTSGGSYNSATGVFTLGSIPAGQTAVFTVDALIESSGTYSVTSEVEAADQDDADSVPANGATTEDDYDQLTFTPGQGFPGNPPDLTCALGATPNELDWTSPAGAYGYDVDVDGFGPKTFTTNGIPVTLSFTGTTSAFTANGTENTPVTNQTLTGGITPAEDGLFLLVQYPDTSSVPVRVIFEFGQPIGGVGGIQIPIFDVDLGDFTDQIVAIGTQDDGAGGTVTRTPFYTTSSSNTFGGGGVIGTGASDLTSAAGNMWVNFSDSIDRLEIVYSNAATTTPPALQGITIGNILYCDPETADLTADKTVEMKTPDAFSIPGETIIYRITVAGGANGNVGAEDVTINDVLPDTLRFVSATTTGFTSGSFASPTLPAANTDCAGGACVVNFQNGTLPLGTTGEVVIEAIIK